MQNQSFCTLRLINIKVRKLSIGSKRLEHTHFQLPEHMHIFVLGIYDFAFQANFRLKTLVIGTLMPVIADTHMLFLGR